MTVLLSTGEAVEGTASIMTIAQSENKTFREINPPNLLDAPHLAELRMDGVAYRIRAPYEPRSLRLVGEPLGTAPAVTKPGIQDQVLGALAEGPLSARQIGDKVECKQRWVFTALAALQKANKVEKCPDSRLYRLVIVE
jgi:hypothetical protein